MEPSTELKIIKKYFFKRVRNTHGWKGAVKCVSCQMRQITLAPAGHHKGCIVAAAIRKIKNAEEET